MDAFENLTHQLSLLGVLESDLVERFIRGSGSGGQKINKTSNCVFLKHLPTGICIKCQAERSRELNRLQARLELCSRLQTIKDQSQLDAIQAIEKSRRQKRPRSRNSKMRSVADKRLLSQKKSLRRTPSGD